MSDIFLGSQMSGLWVSGLKGFHQKDRSRRLNNGFRVLGFRVYLEFRVEACETQRPVGSSAMGSTSSLACFPAAHAAAAQGVRRE